ncbi:MAG: UDP-N-acetylmuramoyl-tripeptide--D-alanyl-D-alanine ligase [Psychroserpens sp.]|nr:UDP-N-acetylmuramoyl-tripeptide--D-alanyl-D-alanine ligase [Psychroserpens sp.]
MSITDLYAAFLECDSVCTDTRKITPNCIFFALKGDNFNGNKFALDAISKGARYAVIDEEAYLTNDSCILVSDVLVSLQNLATYHRQQLKIPIVSLTGSNGKTTTKELINAVLSTSFKTSATKGNFNNHIGVPLTLLEFDSETEIGIVEMGANHQKEIEFLCEIALPDYGLITNFGKAHLEGFGGVEGVIKGKSELYQHLRTNDKTLFVNQNDAKQVAQAGSNDKIITFGNEMQLLSSNPFVKLEFKGKPIQSNLTGAYNYNNICSAIAIGDYFEVEDDKIISAIEGYVPSNNRSQIIEKHGNVIILDAYNANPSSMIVALDNFGIQNGKRKIAILGDMFELGETSASEHQSISEYAQKIGFNEIFLVGEHFYTTESDNTKVIQFRNFEELANHITSNPISESSLLIKGSRGMALERILEFL